MTYTYNILGLQRFAAVELARAMGTLFFIGKNVAIGRIERSQRWGFFAAHRLPVCPIEKTCGAS